MNPIPSVDPGASSSCSTEATSSLAITVGTTHSIQSPHLSSQEHLPASSCCKRLSEQCLASKLAASAPSPTAVLLRAFTSSLQVVGCCLSPPLFSHSLSISRRQASGSWGHLWRMESRRETWSPSLRPRLYHLGLAV